MRRIGIVLVVFVLLWTACTRPSPTPVAPPNSPAGPRPNQAGQAGPPRPGNPPPPPTGRQPAAATPGAGDCIAGDPRSAPLYRHQVYLTTSPDGLTFAAAGTRILAHASVPDLVIGPDGRLWVYFVNGEPGHHGIFVARQTDDGTWETLGCVTLDGVFDGNAVDPNVTRLPDGRYRLVYFRGNFVSQTLPPGADHPIYSAISEDGLHFTVEGQIFAYPGATDPSLVQLPDGSWLLAVTAGGQTVIAHSPDGVTFTPFDQPVPEMGIPELFVFPDGRVGLYLARLFLSADGGRTWQVVADVRVPGDGADPSLVALPTGGYAFAYKRIEGAGPQGMSPQGQPPSPPGQPAPPQPHPAGASSGEVLPRADYLAQVATETPSTSAWRYVTTLFGTLEAGQRYDVGGFCRIFPRANGDGYDVTFGGAFDNRRVEEPRRYAGDVRRTLAADLSAWGEPQRFSEHPGDYAIDTDGQHYYLLNAHPQGWVLGKYDADFNLLKEVIVPLPAGHAANDPMLRVWGGRVYLSGLYNPDNPDMRSNKDANPDDTLYTHVWIYDTDLNPLEDHILDDEPNINGGTLVPYGGGFAYIAADNIRHSNLKALIYDANWHFVRSVPLADDAQWAMGGVVADGRIYIAYHRGEHMHGDVVLDVFDMDWNLLERIEVTAVAPSFNAQRPWVLLDGGRLFVAYDLDNGTEMLNLQCMINVYERR